MSYHTFNSASAQNVNIVIYQQLHFKFLYCDGESIIQHSPHAFSYLGLLKCKKGAAIGGYWGQMHWYMTVKAFSGWSEILGIILQNCFNFTLWIRTKNTNFVHAITATYLMPNTFVSLMMAMYPDFPWYQRFRSKQSEYFDM